MTEKKQIKDWQLALGYFFVLGYLPQVVVGMLYGGLMAILDIPWGTSNIAYGIDMAVQIGAIWVAVHYGGPYVRRAYKIIGPTRVVALATIDFLAIPILVGFISGFFGVSVPDFSVSMAAIAFAGLAIATTVFYFESKRQLVH